MAKKCSPAEREIQALTGELDSINRQLKAAYERFNYACEPELVDASIYEISALKSRYNYFLRCIKERTGTVTARRADTPAAAAADAPCAAAGNMEGGSVCHL